MERLTHISLEDLLETYSIKDKVSFGDKFDFSGEKIILPKEIKNSNNENNIGLVLLLLEIQKLEKKDYSKINNLEYLIENEQNQLKLLDSFLRGYHKSEESFFNNIKGEIKKYLQHLSFNLSSNSSLFAFIKEKLALAENYTNFDDLISEYLNFKASYLEQKNCNNNGKGENGEDNDGEGESGEDNDGEGESLENNNGLEDSDDYYEHDGNLGEEIEGQKDNGVFGEIFPATASKYFSRNILEGYKKGKFVKTKKERNKISLKNPEQKKYSYFYSGKAGKTYLLPIDRFKLQVCDWNDDEIEVFQDNYGSYFIKFKKICQTEIGLGNINNIYTNVSEESRQKLYSGNLDFSNFQSPQDIINWIRETKKYKNVSQQQFNKGNINKNTELLFEAEELDCLPANILFTTICRNIGFASRLVLGISAYNSLNKETKKIKTVLSKNNGHAWSEVFIDGKWQIFDATPIKSDKEDKENQDSSLQEQMQEIILEEAQEEQTEWNASDFELKKAQEEPAVEIDEIIDNKIEHPYFNSAYEYVKNDANEIIEYIRKIMDKRKQEYNKRLMSLKKQNKRKRQPTGKLKISSSSISNLASGNPNIFEKKNKLNPKLEADIDTGLKDISLTIDISGSMGSMTGNWENGQKSDYAYLVMLLLYLVSKELDINFEKVVLFGDFIKTGTPEEILNTFTVNGGGNSVNDQGIEEALKSIKNTKKGSCFILSDGDLATGQEFFNKESRNILSKNPNLFSVGYGLGEDASEKLENKIKAGVSPSVIEYRMWEAGKDNQSKGYPLLEYKKVVEHLKEQLKDFMIQANIKL